MNLTRFLVSRYFFGEKILGFSYACIGRHFIGESARGASVNTFNVDQSARSDVLGGKIALRLLRGIEA